MDKTKGDKLCGKPDVVQGIVAMVLWTYNNESPVDLGCRMRAFERHIYQVYPGSYSFDGHLN